MAYSVHNFEQGDILYASQLNEMDAQIALNEENISTGVSADMLAEEYSANKTYSIGDYVIYNNELYTCIYEITAPEGWNSAHWQIANLGDGISDAKNAIGELNRHLSDLEDGKNLVIAYDTISPYLYKENAYIDANFVEKSLNGYNIYKIPLTDCDILKIEYTGRFWQGLRESFVLRGEDSSGLCDILNNQYASFSLVYDGDTAAGLVFFGSTDGLHGYKAVYITSYADNVGMLKVCLNKPYTQYVYDVKTASKATLETALSSTRYKQVEGLWGTFSAPYITRFYHLYAGDTVIIDKTIAGLSGKGVLFRADGSIAALNVASFTAEEECLLEVYDNTSVSGDIIYIPHNAIDVYAPNLIGELPSNFAGLDGVAFGTSLTYRAISSFGYLTRLSSLSGIAFDNQGIGSSTIIGDMLTAIKEYASYSGKKVCLLEGFVNDWYQSKPLGTWTDTAETTVCGCVRSALNYILSQNANMTVFLILDHYGRLASGLDCSTMAKNANNLTQYEYYNEIAKVAESLGIPVIKEYEVSQISENTPQYLIDNIHCNQLGANQSANAIWSQMKQYYPNLG